MEQPDIQQQIQQKEAGKPLVHLVDLKEKIGEEKLSQIESMMTEKATDITIVDLNGRRIPLGVSAL